MIRASVIVVEDERVVALHLKQQLTRLGYEVPAMATSGEQALRFIGEKKPDVVLMDINIEGSMDGIATAGSIPPELQVPVIYLTAYSEEVTLERARHTKPYGYLIKPFAERELHATIQMVLERRRADSMLRDNEKRLELEVAARTAELVQINAELRQQMSLRAQAEQELHESQKLESLGHLTGGIAHDFNNLLTVILGSLNRIRVRTDLTVEEMHRCADMAIQASQNAATLTERLLAFARRQPLDPKPSNPNQLVIGMSEMLRRTLGESIKVRIALEDEVRKICVDTNQLESALLNVAINARDAMSGIGTLSMETANATLTDAYCSKHKLVKPGHYVMLAVSDTGVGMAKQIVDKCFEPFFTTKEGRGTGLGLSQVHGFITQSGGHVVVESEMGKGTTIKMYLPSFEATSSEDQPVDESANTAVSAGGETILVVEDNEYVRFFVVEELREMGYNVVDAEDGASALKILSTDIAVNLLLTDIGLPDGMSGRQLADRACEVRPELSVLYTSAYAFNEVASKGRIEPGIDLVAKPFTSAVLATKVRTALDRKLPA